MGFRFKRIDLLAGSSDFAVGDTDALRRTRSETILTKCVEAILACNCGWSLDTTHNTTISNFSNVPCRSGSLTFPGLFLINSVSGCKMFIAYFGGNQTANYCIKDLKIADPSSATPPIDIYYYASSYISGLCISIIPSDSNSVFGNTFDSAFLPNDATRIIGTTLYWTTSSESTSFGCNPTSGYIYSWGLFVTPYAIAVSCAKGSGSLGQIGIPTYAAGKIIGTIGHTEDNAVNSKYGILLFRVGDSSTAQCEGITDLFSMTYTVFNLTTPNILGKKIGSGAFYEDTCASICDSNGNWFRPGNTIVNPGFYTQDIFSTSGYFFNKVNECKWSPFAVCAPSTDPSNYSVYNGDCFKGFVDTDLFRVASVSSYGKTFDNGNFISLDSSTAFLIGWDPSNDSLQSPSHIAHNLL